MITKKINTETIKIQAITTDFLYTSSSKVPNRIVN